MTPHALRLLQWLQFKAAIRQIVRGLKTPKGMVIGLVFLIGACGMMIPLAMSLLGPSLDSLDQVTHFSRYVPIGLFFYVLLVMFTSIGTDSLSFSPEEIENLFTAPFSRRQLLIYKLVSTVRYALFGSFFMAMGMAMFIPNILCGMIGIFLTLMFTALVPMLLTLLSQIGSQQFFNRRRKMVGFLMVGVFVLAIGQGAKQTLSSDGNLLEFNRWILEVFETRAGQIILAPTTVFANTIFSPQMNAGFLQNAAIALGINAALLAILIRLDANYLEVVERTSRKLAEMQKNVRLTGGMGVASKKEYSGNFPMLPYWKGMGPLIWRQILVTFRLARWLIVFALILTGLMAIPVLIETGDRLRSEPAIPVIALLGIGYMTFFFSIAAPVGFRPDIHRMEVFKCLPMGSAAIAMGQLLGAVFILSLVQFSMLVLFAAFSMNWFWVWAIGFIAILPINYLAMSVSNIIILLLPVKTASGPKDYAAIGQGVLSSFSLTAAITVMGTCIFGGSALVFLATHNWIATVASGCVVAITFCAIASYVLIIAYRRFDVSLHTPT